MKEWGRAAGGSGRIGKATRVLVAGQVALSLVLLVGAVMFVKTMVNLRAVDLGFNGTPACRRCR